MRPVGAVIFGLLADRYGRRNLLIINVIFFSVIELFCGFSPNFAVFLFLRTLYGIGMGGEWGVGASLAMEAIPVRWRGMLSGILQNGYAVGLFAGGAGLSLRFSGVGLAADVLAGRHSGAARAVYSLKRAGIGGLAEASRAQSTSSGFADRRRAMEALRSTWCC